MRVVDLLEEVDLLEGASLELDDCLDVHFAEYFVPGSTRKSLGGMGSTLSEAFGRSQGLEWSCTG